MFCGAVMGVEHVGTPAKDTQDHPLARGWPILLVFALVWIGIAVLENPSFHSTTLRVDTDIDEFWLNGEERVCQTYPDGKGRVATVACNPTSSRRDRNIPVKFWGSVDRNAVSDWNCRRQGDYFVCRAID